MENVLCLHIFVAERHPDSCNIICMSLFNEKLEDIQMISQLSECLSATKIREQNMFPACDFMFMQLNINSHRVSL